MGTRIIPYSLPEDGTIGIHKMSVTYTQTDDNNHRTEDGDDQFLTVETEDAIVSEEEALNGYGYYFTIKTERWAFDNPDEIHDILSDFMGRLHKRTEESSKKE